MKSFLEKIGYKVDTRIKRAKKVAIRKSYWEAKKIAKQYAKKGWYPRVELDYKKPGYWASYIVKYK